MKRTALVSALGLLVTAPASATTWDFYETNCSSMFNDCTPLPSTPYLLGTFGANGSGSSVLAGGVITGDSFSMDFGPLFVVVDGVQKPFELFDKAVDWNIAWNDDGKPLSIVFDTEDSNLRLRSEFSPVETASDSPWMVGCRGLGDCLFTGFFREATAVPEPTSLALLASAFFGLAWLNRRRKAFGQELVFAPSTD